MPTPAEIRAALEREWEALQSPTAERIPYEDVIAGRTDTWMSMRRESHGVALGTLALALLLATALEDTQP